MNFYWFPPKCQISDLSQLYEDVFGQKTDGTFVEVGAFDGISFSNTVGLALRGWHGHYIEPVKRSYERCRDNMKPYERITVHNLAIGSQDGEAAIHLGGFLSTMNPEMLEVYKRQNWTKEILRHSTVQKTKVLTLNHFLEAHEIEPKFDVLAIDVEGFEWNVLKEFSIERWEPRVIIIELEDEHEMFQKANPQEAALVEGMKKCREKIERHGYELRWLNHINSVYVNASSKTL